MGKLVSVFLTALLLVGMFGCGPYRCPEEEPLVISEPTVVTEYVEKEELVMSMSYILFYDSGRYMPADASLDVLAQIEDEILTWGEQAREIRDIVLEAVRTWWGSPRRVASAWEAGLRHGRHFFGLDAAGGEQAGTPPTAEPVSPKPGSAAP